MESTCLTCGKSFHTCPSRLKSGKAKHCSIQCRNTGETRKCLICNTSFYVPIARVKKGGGKYCSYKCYGIGQRNREKRICVVCGKEFFANQTQVKTGNGHCCSQKCNGINKIGKDVGEMRWNWKGGVTPIYKVIRKSREYKLWRKAVFERDNYTCIWCGARGGNGKTIILQADHIKPFCDYPELRFAIDNGRTLCIPCHKSTGTYGRPSNG